MEPQAPTSLPSGTVTFLFTDIEGSTRLLRDLPDLYGDILDLHHDLLRGVWRRHGGVEVNTEGDAFFVAFADATAALAAAIEGQRLITDAAWPGGRPVRVRMGLHRGFGRPVGGDYRALAVHQAARVVDAANGGQILATSHVLDLNDAGAAPAFHVENLGRFRVRDFDEPVELYRLAVPGRPTDVRPPRVRPADRHNLVRPTTSLVGRDRERADLGVLIEPGALVTLLGPGGCGKTRVAIEVGLDLTDEWQDGVWFVDMGPLASGDVVPMAIAGAVNAPSTLGNDAWADVVAHLAGLRALLVLDNCEHLAAPIARLVHDARQRCPELGMLATSRVPLGLVGEKLFRLDPLRADDEHSDAIELFAERASGGAEIDVGDVVELCRAVDGLPLAIELAATRTHVLSPAEMVARMRRSVAVVSSGDPTLPDRQRSLSHVLDWSLDLLGPAERRLLTHLAVIADGFDLSLAEAVSDADARNADVVPELVWSLVDWSLVQREAAAGSTRYSMLSTVRSYALQRADAGDVAAARHRLGDSLATRLGPERAMSREWVTEMGSELENVRGVVDHADVPDEVARPLAWSIGVHHDVTSTFRSGIAEIARAVERRPAPGPDLVALLTLQADLHLRLGEVKVAAQVVRRAAALVEQVGVPHWDDMGVVRSQGELALRSDDAAAAVRLAEDALRCGTASPRSEARLWNLVAIAHHALGDVEAACTALDHCLRAEEDAGLDTFLANTHGNYAEALLELGDPVAAAAHQLAALEMARSMGQVVNVAFSFMVAARFALAEGAASDAVTVQSGADLILAREGFSLYEADARQRADLLDAARRQLSQEQFDAADTDGRTMPVDQLADQTAAILRRRAGAPPSQQEGEHVTSRPGTA